MTEASRRRVLVVDDSATMRQKLSVAVRNLGHDPSVAADGREALARLAEGDIDLVILDLVMPELDGFAVLRAMKQDPALQELPVLVVSSLEEAADAARAIELGATDVLSKSVDRVLLAARVNSSLERRRLRTAELAYLAEAQKLMEAARTVETSSFDPDKLGLGEVARRKDALGDLARVFVRMATVIHRREVHYDRQIVLLQGALLLLVVAVPYGLMPTLSRVLAETQYHPLGISAYVLLCEAAILVPISLARGKLPTLSPGRLLFGLQATIIGTVLPQIVILVAAEHLEASVIAVVIALESALVFVLAAVLRLESFDMRRFAGVCLGLLAILLVVIPDLRRGLGDAHLLWMLPALFAALLFAVESILLAVRSDHADDAIQTVTLITVLGAVVTFPLAYLVGVLPPLSSVTARAGLAISTLALIASGCFVGYVFTVRKTGAVFASQHTAPLAIAGVVWTTLLLGEAPTPWLWSALVCMTAGLLLVRPREEVLSGDGR